jgi:hypothetical protein
LKKEVIYILFRVNQPYLSFKNIYERKNLNLSLITEDEGCSTDICFSKIVAILDLYHDDFYTTDLVDFFLLKTKHNEKGILKYTSVLKLIGLALSKYDAISWQDIGFMFWEELITYEFMYDGIDICYEHANSFFSVLIEFIEWLDRKYNWNYSSYIKYIINKNKHDLLDCIYLRNRMKKENKLHFHEEVYTFRMKNEEKIPGLFLVEDRKEESVYTYELVTNKRFKFKIPKIINNKVLKVGIVFHAIIGKSLAEFEYELVYLKCIYPPKAVSYLIYNI